MSNKEYQRNYRQQNKEKLRSQNKDWHKEHPGRYAMYSRNWRRRNPTHQLWLRVRDRAAREGQEFTILETDILIPTHCPYLGIELVIAPPLESRDSALSLDRVDNTKGYIPGNIEVISYLANRMKNSATKEQLITFANSIRSRYVTAITSD